MPSNLHNKINSYPLERGIEFNSAYPTTSPYIGARTGTNPLGTYTKNSTSNIVWEPTVGPIGGAGSWKLQWDTVTATNSYVRGTTVNATELTGVADNDWSMGFWFKLNSLPTGSSLSAAGLMLFGDSVCGFTAYVSGNTSSHGNRIYFTVTGYGGVTAWHPNQLVTNRWYYFAVTKSATQYKFHLDGVSLFSFNQTGTGVASTLMWGDTSARTFTGSWNISNFYLAPASVINSTAISEIWTAGSTLPRTVKYFDGTTWQTSSAQKVWNGTTWVDWNAKKYDGTQWITI